MKILPAGAELLSADRRTHRHVAKLRVALCSFAKAPNYETLS